MEIDTIIEKAKLIKKADNPKGIDNLIKSLESYKANKGDLEGQYQEAHRKRIILER